VETLFGSESGGQKKRGKSWRFWLFVLSPFLILGMCGVFFVKAKEAGLQAEHEVAVFHERLESAQYDAIWTAAAPALRASTSQLVFSLYLDGIHDKMGSCAAPSKPITYVANANTSGTTVRLQYRIKCANGALDEAFTFEKNDTMMALLGYQASNPFLPK
jgi:hypothetical protein